MKKNVLLFILICGITSCSKVSSGGFWTKFRESEIISKHLDHGPYGGTTEINWQRRIAKEKEFTVGEIIKYATDNGWKYVNTVSAEKLCNSKDFSSRILTERFGCAKIEGSKIICFESNFLTIDENEKLDTKKNCFVILNPNDSMILYHRWGDY